MKITLTLNENEYSILNDVLSKIPVLVINYISERNHMYDNYGMSHQDIVKAYLNVKNSLKPNCSYLELDEHDAKVFSTWLGEQDLKDSRYIRKSIDTEYLSKEIEATLYHLYEDIESNIKTKWYIRG